jgi:hypothetical protein
MLLFRLFQQLFARLFRRNRPGRGPDVDPYASVRVSRRGGPGGRSSAIALMEPEPPRSVDALGRLFRKQR